MAFHFKPSHLVEGKANATEIARLIRRMGVEPNDVYFRFISNRQIDAALANGTDRDSRSTSHNDDYGNGTSYEAAAMREHGIYDRASTSYLLDGAGLERPDAGYTLDTNHSALIVYRKDPEIIPINAFKYLKPGESPSSFGFHIFKNHPSKFLVGAVSASGQELPEIDSKPERADGKFWADASSDRSGRKLGG